jgi:hypothetical protein
MRDGNATGYQNLTGQQTSTATIRPLPKITACLLSPRVADTNLCVWGCDFDLHTRLTKANEKTYP